MRETLFIKAASQAGFDLRAFQASLPEVQIFATPEEAIGKVRTLPNGQRIKITGVNPDGREEFSFVSE